MTSPSGCRFLVAWLALSIGLALSAGLPGEPLDPTERDCALKMRKVLEATQEYRRLHQGAWPESLSQLLAAGLLRAGDDACPLITLERAAELPEGYWSSQGKDRDAPGSYQYELGKIDLWRELKLKLLRRPFAEQVSVLRCERHGESKGFVNVAASGAVYLSPYFWESNFVNDVPLPYRGPLLVSWHRDHPVPPFSNGLPPRDPGLPATAVDLTPWCNAFPQDPWWWGNDEWNGKAAPTLAALMAAFPNGHASIPEIPGDGNIPFDIRGVVQLGTCLPNSSGTPPDPKEAGKGSGLPIGYMFPSFPSERVGLKLKQKAGRVAMLVGAIWPAPLGSTSGRFIWHLQDGTAAVAELSYGRDLARFFGDDPAPAPGWGSAEVWGKTRLWLVEWRNPHPEMEIESVDFVANRESRASPFLVGMTLLP